MAAASVMDRCLFGCPDSSVAPEFPAVLHRASLWPSDTADGQILCSVWGPEGTEKLRLPVEPTVHLSSRYKPRGRENTPPHGPPAGQDSNVDVGGNSQGFQCSVGQPSGSVYSYSWLGEPRGQSASDYAIVKQADARRDTDKTRPTILVANVPRVFLSVCCEEQSP
eukprot:bmy_14413T0